MGYAYGINDKGREVGYSVQAKCDWPDCDTDIDRGMYFQCGGGEQSQEEVPYCCDFFCDKHKPGEVCLKCEENLECPSCNGDGCDDKADDGLCACCDSMGILTVEQWLDDRKVGSGI